MANEAIKTESNVGAVGVPEWPAGCVPYWDYDMCYGGDGCYLNVSRDEHGELSFDVTIPGGIEGFPGIHEMNIDELKRLRLLLNVALARFGE